MPLRRAGGQRNHKGQRNDDGNPPSRRVIRNAKIAALPIGFAGRRMAGAGRRALGTPAEVVDRDIQRRTAQHIFEVLGELKGCAAKLGQILSVYELALPPELAEPYREALTRLQDSAPPMLPATVHQAMAASLGPEWRSNFREFEDRRAASATIGQVHRAVWHDGRAVAVKVMYPGARAAVLSDLEQLRRMCSLVSVFVPGADVRAVTEELSACIRAELDYAAEADHQRVFAAAFAGDPDFRVPEVVAQRGDVIVSEWLEGIPLHRVISSGAQAERDRVGLLALRFVVSAPERCGLLYADPHPGNFRILPDGRLGVVDFGACEPWPVPQFHPLVREVADAMLNGGPGELEAAARKHGFATAQHSFDEQALAAEVRPFTDILLHDNYQMDKEWLRRQVMRFLNPRLNNVNRHLDLPAYCAPFARSVVTMLGLLCQLGTTGPVRDEMLRWSPELAEVVERHRERAGQPTDLTVVRLRRAAAQERNTAAG
ncbi:ABC1 kinase family protein [Nocardia sp. NPDC020380]|uniref:ABC1 kinase family protein n=1 Tax=Nocardia sp. NPDC020380 TaxID=3364309 RepID=UPI0037885D04